MNYQLFFMSLLRKQNGCQGKFRNLIPIHWREQILFFNAFFDKYTSKNKTGGFSTLYNAYLWTIISKLLIEIGNTYRLNSKESYILCEFVIILPVEFRRLNSGIHNWTPYLFLKLINYSATLPSIYMKITHPSFIHFIH